MTDTTFEETFGSVLEKRTRLTESWGFGIFHTKESGTQLLTSIFSTAHGSVARRLSRAKSEKAERLNRSSTIRSSAEVFDIVNAGPQHRFLILTINGPMIVHNCGYQLGGGDERLNVKTGRMEKTGLWGYAAAMKIHLTKEQSHEAVKVFRDTFPAIVQLWYDLDDAFRSAIGSKLARRVGFMTLRWEKPFVTIELPSGRKLYYCSPEIQPRIPPWELDNEKPKSRPTITFKQIDQKSNSWVRTTTHGGKLTENVCQAVANDVLNEGLWRAEQGIGLPEPYEIIGHVHDEGIALVPWDSPLTVEHLSACLSHPVPWAPDLPLAAHGFTTQIYRKD
jgi:DNA polymerase